MTSRSGSIDKNPCRDEAHSSDNEVNEDTPRTSGVMIHVVPETGKARWNHVEDLDSFFARMYSYHQNHGFRVIALEKIFELVQFVFVVWLLVFTAKCVRFSVLFGDERPSSNASKVTIPDVVMPGRECINTFGGWTWLTLIMASFILAFRFVRMCYHMVQYWDIKKFFNIALKIEDSSLDNLSWHDVQKKVREVQSEQQMCIHKEQLTELDIYHRILRFKNYTVAMMNKSMLPTRMMVPFLGEVGCLSRGLKFNIELLLFRGPWSPFENNWNLREEYKRSNRRVELARQLSRQILWLAIVNLILSPFIFFWQVVYISFSYAALLRKEPSVLGSRCWSQYGKLHLRHFNELDHELDARLTRAYAPADRYIGSFSSPVLAVIAKNIVFICGGGLAVILLLTVYNEHVMQVEHVITIASILTVIAVAARNFTPAENLNWCPEQLLTTVLAHVHYLPSSWRGLAHTNKVRGEFEYFFQLKVIYLLTELFSPFVIPFVLIRSFRPRALDIVDFFRNFTVSVVGVGDVCSFAQMDVRKHGNPDWQIVHESDETDNVLTTESAQGEHGKTELSLIHFTLTNPEWKMPTQARQFLHSIRNHALTDLNKLKFGLMETGTGTAMEQSLISFGNIGDGYSSIANSVLHNHSFGTPSQPTDVQRPGLNLPLAHGSGHTFDFNHMLRRNLNDVSATATPSGLHNIQEGDAEEEGIELSRISSVSLTSMEKSIVRGATKIEGKVEGSTDGLLYSIYGNHPVVTGDPYGVTAAEMCLSALHMHEIHYRKIQRKFTRLNQSHRQASHLDDFDIASPNRSIPRTLAESTPLLYPKQS